MINYRIEINKGCEPITYSKPVHLEPWFEFEKNLSGINNYSEFSMPPAPYYPKSDSLSHVRLHYRSEEKDHWQKSEMTLKTMASLQGIASFEIIGNQNRIQFTISSSKNDLHLVSESYNINLFGLYFESCDDPLAASIKSLKGKAIPLEFNFLDFYPSPPFFYSFTSIEDFKTVDSLENIYRGLSGLSDNEFAVYQLLFQPCRNNWQQKIRGMLGKRKQYERSRHPYFSPWQLKEYTAVAQKKINNEKPMFACSLRIGVFSPIGRSNKILKRLKGGLSHFLQNGRPLNYLTRRFYSKVLDSRKHIDIFLDRISYRAGMLLNSGELAALCHLPYPDVHKKKVYPFQAPKKSIKPPDSVLGPGLLVGHTSFQGQKYPVRISPDLRNRHVFLLGKTRTGKSNLIKNMITQDLESGHGLALIDPTGDLIEKDILPLVPKDRINDVIYLNASDWRKYPFSLNVLDPQGACVSDISDDFVDFMRTLHIDSWGPQMEDILKTTLETLLRTPGKKVLGDINRTLLDHQYRQSLLKSLDDPDILRWWKFAFPPLAKRVNPVLNKIRDFGFHEKLKAFFVSPDNSVHFRHVLDQRKILLCNLSKHILKEQNARFLGGLAISKILIAALARADNPDQKHRPDFYLYIDECHNYQVSSMRTILSEGAKFRLNLIMATQYLKQLIPEIRNAVLGNVGSIISFRSSEDVAKEVNQYMRHFEIKDFLDLDVGEAIVMADKASDSFLMKTQFEPTTDPGFSDEIIARNRKRFREERERNKRKPEKTEKVQNAGIHKDSFFE